MNSKDQPTQSDIQPEGGIVFGRGYTEDVKVVDEMDAEGHGKKFPEPSTGSAGIGPEGAVRRNLHEDEPVGGQQPGDPDNTRFSDQNLKVHVMPVVW